MQSEPNNRMFSTRSKMSTAGLITALAFFAANAAQAGASFYGQGYYPSNCYDYNIICTLESSATPHATYSAGMIDEKTFNMQVSMNYNACGMAYGNCYGRPVSSPASPSGRIYTYSVTLPY